MSNKNTKDSVSYREERKKQLAKAKKVTSGKAMTPNTKKIITRIVACAIAIILVVGVAFIISYNSGLPERTKAAVTVGDTKISIAEYNYFYNTTTQNFINNYSSVLTNMGFDSSKAYDEQYYSEENNVTWADFFHQQTLSSIQNTVMLCAEAEKEGYKMTDADKAEVKEAMDAIKGYAKDSSVSTSYYLSYVYGKGTNKSVVKDVIKMYTLANSYSEYKYDSFSASDDEIETYYNENKNDFDVVTYRSYTANGSIEATDDETELTDEQVAANKAEAQGIAEEFANRITDEASFNTLASEYSDGDSKYDDADATLTSESSYSTVSSRSEDLANWLFDDARQAGDTATFESGDDAYMVVYFVEKGRYDYNTQDVRHILFQFDKETDDSGNETLVEGTEEATYEEAEKVYNEYMGGSGSEEAFAALAEKYSEDGGSVANGGLYEEIYKGQMVSEFEDWAFDSSRKAGDVEIIETSYGYHIMYYVGQNRPYYQVQVNNTICEADYNEFLSSVSGNYSVAEVKANLPLTAYGGNGVLAETSNEGSENESETSAE